MVGATVAAAIETIKGFDGLADDDDNEGWCSMFAAARCGRMEIRPMKKAITWLVFWCAIALSGLWSQSASAQQRYRSPSGPALSPYLNYFRRDVGVLDNYHTFVRPEQRLMQSLSQQQSELRRTQLQLGQVQTDVRGMSKELLAPSAASPTGRTATFLNYSHFYSGVGAGAGAARR